MLPLSYELIALGDVTLITERPAPQQILRCYSSLDI